MFEKIEKKNSHKLPRKIKKIENAHTKREGEKAYIQYNSNN